MKKQEFICCICGKTCKGEGNNPYPVRVEGRCCEKCNLEYVVPVRLFHLVRNSKLNFVNR